MFEAIRRNQRALLLALVLLIFPAFAFFGISGYDNFFAPDTDVAVVGESPISAAEFDQAKRSQVDNMRRMLGDQLDPAMFDSPAAEAQILEGLIDQRVLAVRAQTSRLLVPDDAVRDAIAAIPDIRSADGSFDMERYRMLLRAQGMNEVQFENQVRADLAMRLIPDSVTATAFVPAAVSDRLARLAGQERVVKTREFNPEDYVSQVEVDPAVVRKYYDDNASQFSSPESAVINYLVLSQSVLAEAASVSDEEKRAFYEQNQARYGQEEQRAASHILVPLAPGADDAARSAARDKAQALQARVSGGEDFAEVARAESGDPGSAEQGGDLGFFDRDTMAESFADSAFTLGEGEISDVVETEFGFHVIKVTEIRPRQVKPFDEVAAQIESDLRREKGRAAYQERLDAFSNTVYEQPDSLDPAAEKTGLTVQKLDDFRRFGSPGLTPDSPLNNPKVVRAVFDPDSIARKMNTEAIDVGDNTVVSVRVLEHKPSAVQPFEEVEAQVQSVVRADKAAQLAREAGEQALRSLQSGASVSAGPDAAQASFGDPITVSRTARTLSPAALAAAFAQPASPLPAYFGVELGRSGYLIGELLEVRDIPADRLDEAKAAAAAQVASAAGQVSFDAWLEAAKAGLVVERRLDRLASGNDEAGSAPR